MAKPQSTLFHALDGEIEFVHGVDVGPALVHPEWKKTPWTDAEIAAYKAGVAAYEAMQPKIDDKGFEKPQSKSEIAAMHKARGVLKAAIIKAGGAAAAAEAAAEKAAAEKTS